VEENNIKQINPIDKLSKSQLKDNIKSNKINLDSDSGITTSSLSDFQNRLNLICEMEEKDDIVSVNQFYKRKNVK